jgi:hypothetical protein
VTSDCHDRGPVVDPQTAGPFRVRIEECLLKPNIPAGMDIAIVAVLAARLRKTAKDWEPIYVRREGAYWRVMDGRHRFFASVIAGRPDVLAVEEA